MTDTPKARPEWAVAGSKPDDKICAHRVPFQGSQMQFARCLKDAESEYNGYPVCRTHARRLEAA